MPSIPLEQFTASIFACSRGRRMPQENFWPARREAAMNAFTYRMRSAVK
jgi:hypothetical protein